MAMTKKSESKYVVTCAWHKSLNVFANIVPTNKYFIKCIKKYISVLSQWMYVYCRKKSFLM